MDVDAKTLGLGVAALIGGAILTTVARDYASLPARVTHNETEIAGVAESLDALTAAVTKDKEAEIEALKRENDSYRQQRQMPAPPTGTVICDQAGKCYTLQREDTK